MSSAVFNGPPTNPTPELIVDENLRINFSRHWIDIRKDPLKDFERVTLTPIESRIMHILIRNAGRVMTTEALLARVWTDD